MSLQDSPYAGKRVAVWGAGGFIGRWVANLLSRSGAELRLFVRDRASTEPLFQTYDIQATIVEYDAVDSSSLQDLFNKFKPTVSFNLVGYGVDRLERDEQASYLINRDFVRVLAEAAAANRDPHWQGADLVHCGSALEYGEVTGQLSETTSPQPTTLYGKSKLAGTLALREVCHATGLKGLTARLFTVYGPGEHRHRLLPSLMSCSAEYGKSIGLTNGCQKRDFVYVEDVADGLLRLGHAANVPQGEIINFGSGRLTTVRRFIETAAEKLQIPRPLLKFGEIPTRDEEMNHDPVSIGRLKGYTSWVPETTIAEGVVRTREFDRLHMSS